MRLVITEHILFGSLRPWILANEGGDTPPFRPLHELTDIPLLLEEHPEVAGEVQREWLGILNEPGEAEPFISLEVLEPYDGLTVRYAGLIRFENQVFVKHLKMLDEEADAMADLAYEVNLLIRQLADLLLCVHQLLSKKRNKWTKQVMTISRQHLVRLLMETGLRFEHLEAVDRYDEQRLFDLMLNSRPKRTLFTKTPAYWKYRLQRLLEEEDQAPKIAELWNEMYSKTKGCDSDAISKAGSGKGFTKFVHHLENILFLILAEASFVSEHPEKLQDAAHCREWVVGIQHEFLNEEKVSKAATMFNKLVDVADRFTGFLQAVGPSAGLAGEPVSEAVRLMSAIGSISDRRLQTGAGMNMMAENRNKGKKVGESFAESFEERFISLEQFDSVFPGTREATMRYVAKGNIRKLEISREVIFLYRSDVERFLDKRTVEK